MADVNRSNYWQVLVKLLLRRTETAFLFAPLSSSKVERKKGSKKVRANDKG